MFISKLLLKHWCNSPICRRRERRMGLWGWYVHKFIVVL